ncbi:Cold-shock DNA-binding domain containing protein [Novymonas esmeraldas]|uniref:Cold-shock DNA-binding domain containing protein n=1 Tax=Novymonas esmeraldas TaxID=1808958 RepID=A0AAW0F8K1_9TRYP
MFRAVHSNPMAGVPAGGDMNTWRPSAQPMPMPMPMPYASAPHMSQGYPVVLPDGCTVMYCVSAPGLSTAPQLSMLPSAGDAQPWLSTATASANRNGSQLATDLYSPLWFATANSSDPSAASLHGGAPAMLQHPVHTTHLVPEKHHQLPSMISQQSSTMSRAAGDTSSPGGATMSAFDTSVTSISSSTVGSAAANVSTAPLSACAGYPGFQMAVPLPTGPVGAMAPPPPPAHTCFWVNRATGALTPIRTDDAMSVSAMHSSVNGASYPLPPPPPPGASSQSVSGSVASGPAYLMAPQVSFSTGSMMAASSVASLSGSAAFVVPPAPPKMVNGLQYQLGGVYEGFVKRYNPNRGFGFLTATLHVTVASDAGSEHGSEVGSTAPAVSLNASAASAPPCGEPKPPQEIRTPVNLGDIFVHQSYMHMHGFRTLPVGGRVRFRVGYKDGQQTFQAVDVELLPQVLPANLEMIASTTSGSQQCAALVGFDAKAASVTSSAPLSEPQPLYSAADGGAASISSSSKARAINYTPLEDDGDDEEDQPLIELTYNMYTGFD